MTDDELDQGPDLTNLPPELINQLSRAFLRESEPRPKQDRFDEISEIMTEEWQSIDELLITFWRVHSIVRRRNRFSGDLMEMAQLNLLDRTSVENGTNRRQMLYRIYTGDE